MTPGQAQELLKRATPGPWELERIDGMLHIFLPTGNGAPEEQDMPLIAAAPELAEIVAGLRYEYAVQKLDGNEWKLTDLDGRALESYETEKITWWADPIPYSDIADRGPGWRIVRRLVGNRR